MNCATRATLLPTTAGFSLSQFTSLMFTYQEVSLSGSQQ